MVVDAIQKFESAGPISIDEFNLHNRRRRLFVSCPLLDSCVDVENVCGKACPGDHFVGLVIPDLKKLLRRLDAKEITVEYLEDAYEKLKRRPERYAVICTYPRLLQANAFIEDLD